MPRCCFRLNSLDLICLDLLLDWDSTGDEDNLPSREQRVVKQTVKLKMKSHKDLKFHKKNIEKMIRSKYMCLFKMFQIYFLFAILSGLFFSITFSHKKKTIYQTQTGRAFGWAKQLLLWFRFQKFGSCRDVLHVRRLLRLDVQCGEGYNEWMQKWWQKLAMQKHPIFETSPTRCYSINWMFNLVNLALK